MKSRIAWVPKKVDGEKLSDLREFHELSHELSRQFKIIATEVKSFSKIRDPWWRKKITNKEYYSILSVPNIPLKTENMNAQPYVEKIFINLNAPNSFSLRQKILGENSANLKYIVKETEANVSLRGRGSGFVEQNGQESNELLHLLIDHPSPNNLNEAKILASNLIETIQQELQMFLQANPQNVHIQHHPQPPPIAQTVVPFQLFSFHQI